MNGRPPISPLFPYPPLSRSRARVFSARRAPGRRHALQQAPWDPPAVRAVALAHDICPYYLSQELVRWSDVVVADYHYFYDSAAMLYALTQAQQWKVGVLVDEAHNLLERARRMYTAELSQFALAAARKAATDRKSTRLNSSHLVISYAVFCLKKKNITTHRPGQKQRII